MEEVALISICIIPIVSVLLMRSLNRGSFDNPNTITSFTYLLKKVPKIHIPFLSSAGVALCGMGRNPKANSEELQLDNNTVEELSMAMASKAFIFDLLPPLSPEQDVNTEWLKEVALLGRVVADVPISLENVIKATRSWGMSELIMVSYRGFNTFQLEFGSTEDKLKAWHNRPWSVAGHQFVLGPWHEDFSPVNHELYFTVLWLQAKGLQPKYNNRSTALKICKRMEVELLEVDIPEGVSLSQLPYLRFKVTWDTRNPIIVGLPYPQSDGGVGWIVLQYERVSSFCFSCGRLGHEPRGCKYAPMMIPFPTGTIPLRNIAFDAKAVPNHFPEHIKALIPATTLKILYPESQGLPSQHSRTLGTVNTDLRSARENLLPTNLVSSNEQSMWRTKEKQVASESYFMHQQDQSQAMLLNHIGCSNFRDIGIGNNCWWNNQATGTMNINNQENINLFHSGDQEESLNRLYIQGNINQMGPLNNETERTLMDKGPVELGSRESLVAIHKFLTKNQEKRAVEDQGELCGVVKGLNQNQKTEAHVPATNAKNTQGRRSRPNTRSSSKKTATAQTKNAPVWINKESVGISKTTTVKKRSGLTMQGDKEQKKLCFSPAECDLSLAGEPFRKECVLNKEDVSGLEIGSKGKEIGLESNSSTSCKTEEPKQPQSSAQP